MNQNTSATVQVADYVLQLFPNFGPQETNAVAAQYAYLGTNIFQVNAIMGECECLSKHGREEAADFYLNWQQFSSVLPIICYVLLTVAVSRLVFLSRAALS